MENPIQARKARTAFLIDRDGTPVDSVDFHVPGWRETKRLGRQRAAISASFLRAENRHAKASSSRSVYSCDLLDLGVPAYFLRRPMGPQRAGSTYRKAGTRLASTQALYRRAGINGAGACGTQFALT